MRRVCRLHTRAGHDRGRLCPGRPRRDGDSRAGGRRRLRIAGGRDDRGARGVGGVLGPCTNPARRCSSSWPRSRSPTRAAGCSRSATSAVSPGRPPLIGACSDGPPRPAPRCAGARATSTGRRASWTSAANITYGPVRSLHVVIPSSWKRRAPIPAWIGRHGTTRFLVSRVDIPASIGRARFYGLVARSARRWGLRAVGWTNRVPGNADRVNVVGFREIPQSVPGSSSSAIRGLRATPRLARASPTSGESSPNAMSSSASESRG